MTNFADVRLIDIAALARGGAQAARQMLIIERACACEGFFRFRDNAGVPEELVQQNFELDRALWLSSPEQLATLFTDPSLDLSGRGIETKGARTLDVRVAKGKNDISKSLGWTREFTEYEAHELEIRCKGVFGVVSGQPPEPEGSRRKARGVDGESADRSAPSHEYRSSSPLYQSPPLVLRGNRMSPAVPNI
jgi:hypothetical protein